MMAKINDKKGFDTCEMDLNKPDQLELIIIPQEKFLEWYQYTRGQVENIEKQDGELNNLECPNCCTKMQEFVITKPPDKELWHLCPKCNLSFSKRQHIYFRRMMKRLIKNSYK